MGDHRPDEDITLAQPLDDDDVDALTGGRDPNPTPIWYIQNPDDPTSG